MSVGQPTAFQKMRANRARPASPRARMARLQDQIDAIEVEMDAEWRAQHGHRPPEPDSTLGPSRGTWLFNLLARR